MQIVIGLGEIGTAIQKILGCEGYDQRMGLLEKPMKHEVIHICFPYFKGFEKEVRNYKKKFRAKLVIIHSTVPIGTSEKLNSVASPCRGVHPHLEEGIRTFTKFFGGEKAEEAAKLFSSHGITTYSCKDSRSIEAMKLWDTTIYGFNIVLEKEIHRFCEENDLDFDKVYTKANISYNEGYEELGKPQFKKYILKHSEGKIGGHCVIPNCDLLDSWVAKTIKKKNNEY